MIGGAGCAVAKVPLRLFEEIRLIIEFDAQRLIADRVAIEFRHRPDSDIVRFFGGIFTAITPNA